jgi:hypothetical protein
MLAAKAVLDQAVPNPAPRHSAKSAVCAVAPVARFIECPYCPKMLSLKTNALNARTQHDAEDGIRRTSTAERKTTEAELPNKNARTGERSELQTAERKRTEENETAMLAYYDA